MSVISYPRPLYSDPAIRYSYKPNRLNISAITQGATTTITTSADHNFVIGQLVRFIIPPDYGMREINNLDTPITQAPDIILRNEPETATDGTATYSQEVLASYKMANPNLFINTQTLKIFIDAGGANETIYIDDGLGNIIYVSGTYTIDESTSSIDYETTILTLSFTATPPISTSVTINCSYNLGVYTNRFYIPINSTPFTAFTNPGTSTPAQVLAIGDILNGYTSTTGANVASVAIPGSFINISPQETS